MEDLKPSFPSFLRFFFHCQFLLLLLLPLLLLLHKLGIKKAGLGPGLLDRLGDLRELQRLGQAECVVVALHHRVCLNTVAVEWRVQQKLDAVQMPSDPKKVLKWELKG